MTFTVVGPSQAVSASLNFHILIPFRKFSSLLLSLFISISEKKNSLNHNHMSSLYMLSSFLPSLPTFFLLSFGFSPFFSWTNIYNKSTLSPFLFCSPSSAHSFTLSPSLLKMRLTAEVLLQTWLVSLYSAVVIFLDLTIRSLLIQAKVTCIGEDHPIFGSRCAHNQWNPPGCLTGARLFPFWTHRTEHFHHYVQTTCLFLLWFIL